MWSDDLVGRSTARNLRSGPVFDAGKRESAHEVERGGTNESPDESDCRRVPCVPLICAVNLTSGKRQKPVDLMVRCSGECETILLQEMGAQEREYLPDNLARGGAIVKQVEGMGTRGVIDERNGQIAGQCSRHEPVNCLIQARELVQARSRQE